MPLLSLLYGAIVGLSLGLTGGGGAIFAVPLLVYGLGVPAREAVGISLVSVGLTSFIGFLKKWQQCDVELPTGLLFAAAGMLGAPIGAWLARLLPETVLMFLFAGLMLTIAARMWMKAGHSATEVPACEIGGRSGETAALEAADGPGCQRDAAGRLILSSRCVRLLLLVGILAGILSGMFGVGGGFIIVPALVLFSGMSIVRAVGTSLMVISMVSVSGVVSLLLAGQVIPLEITSLFAVGGITGLMLGQSVGHRLSSTMLQRVFSVAILMVATFVIVRNFSQG
jgi:hypothetical protein